MSIMRFGMPTRSLGMPTTDPSEVQYPIMHPVTTVDLTAPDTIPPPSIGPGMPRGYSPPLLPMVTTATLLMPRGNSPPLLPMVTSATFLPQRRLLYPTPRKGTRRRAVSATTPHRKTSGIPGVGMPKTRLGMPGVGMPNHRQWRVPLIPPTESGELLTDWTCVPIPMVQGWRSTEEMHAETLAHSTKQMRRTKTWRKLGAGKKRVYVCTTYDTNPNSCPYRITWTKKSWAAA